MEHRWGRRVGLNMPVLLLTESHTPVLGRIENVSVSGAFIRVAAREPLPSYLQVEVIVPDKPSHVAERVPAFVTRRNGDGVGIEWRDLAPLPVRILVAAPDRNAAKTDGRAQSRSLSSEKELPAPGSLNSQ